MFKYVIPAAAALGLVAFAAQTKTPVDDLAGSAPAGMAWSVTHEGSMAKLAYGLPNSDQLALMITCEPGQAEAVVYGDMHPDSPRLVRASSAPTMLDPLSGGDATETRISIDDPALKGLVSRGRLPVAGEAGRYQLSADREERRMVAGFLSYCGSTRGLTHS